MTRSITTNIKPNILITKRDKLTRLLVAGELQLQRMQLKKVLLVIMIYEHQLTHIRAMYEELVILKLRIQCANMGMKFKDLPKDANIINIYKLSALNEFYVKLGEMAKEHTINPVLKAKKGKRNLDITEELTRTYFRNMQNGCLLTLNSLRKAIADFNDNTDLSDDSAPLYLVA